MADQITAFLDYLEKFIAVSPSAALRLPSEADIREAEARYGGFPATYKAFIRNYGSGMLAEYVVIFSPGHNFDQKTLLGGEGMRIMREVIPELQKLRFYPEEGGLLAYASTIDNHWFFWDRAGSADDWETIVIDCGYQVVRFHAARVLSFSILSRSRSTTDVIECD